jgi:hypothetical protein
MCETTAELLGGPKSAVPPTFFANLTALAEMRLQLGHLARADSDAKRHATMPKQPHAPKKK